MYVRGCMGEPTPRDQLLDAESVTIGLRIWNTATDFMATAVYRVMWNERRQLRLEAYGA
jgi:hypothetical protein